MRLKHKNDIKIAKKKLVTLLTLKLANGLKTSYGEIFGTLLVFFDQKYNFLQILDIKTETTRLKLSKKKLVTLLTLKRANGLKTSYGEIFGKLLVFFTKSTTFFTSLTLKQKKQD